jgi:hypothetical protein
MQTSVVFFDHASFLRLQPDLDQADSREADDVMSYRSAIAYNEQR